MTTPIKSWLDNAILQSVAESYLELYSQFGGSHEDLAEILRAGVNHLDLNPNGQGATRLTDTQFTWFDTNYKIVSHYPSDASGFSATLFQNRATGEYTLSFRSTEFQFGAVDNRKNPDLPDQGGDWARDGAPGADGEVSNDGFALGQLSDMETYYQYLKDLHKLPAGSTLNVTGYSLGAQLSTAFTLMHWDEVSHTYNFNAAGMQASAGNTEWKLAA